MGAQLQQCGFFGLGPTVSEADLRAAIRFVAKAEQQHWFDSAGKSLGETANQQFGHLVRYWLAGMDTIVPSTLTFAQTKAIDSATNYGDIPVNLDSVSVIADWVALVLPQLIHGAPGGGSSPDLKLRVEAALRGALDSRLGTVNGPWSAVFIVSCIRRAAIIRGLDGESGGSLVGRNELLLAHIGHRFYVAKAYERRLGPNLSKGTYHAFRPDEQPVQVGDMVVQDRKVSTFADVVDFADIPTKFKGPYPLHSDIVVEVNDSDIETIGGNLISGIPAASDVFSVRRRRFPIDSDGKLVVLRKRLYTQEDDNGNLPPIPAADSPDDMNDKSTGRIFTLLKPVVLCVTVSANG